MRELFVAADTLPEAYHQALVELAENGQTAGCPDYNQLQKECSMTIVVENPVKEPRISRLVLGDHHELQQYVMEVLDGILDFNSGCGKSRACTCHTRYAPQMPFVLSELTRNPLSRRAIINLRCFEVDSKAANPLSLQSIQFFIRDDKLHMKVLYRSDDLPGGFFFSAFGLIKLQEKVAALLAVDVGTYTHRSNSLHCYEKDFTLLDGYVRDIKTKSLEELTFEYEGYYENLMEAEIPIILKKVEALKQLMKSPKKQK